MTLIRSLAFAAFFYLWSVVIVLLMLPCAVISPAWVLGWARLWTRVATAGLGVICGVRVEVRGAHNIPQGPALIAAKHQCMFDTFFPVSLLSHPCLVAKRELRRIPLFAWYGARSGVMLIIDRDGRAKALRGLMAQARRALSEGRQLIIYPEGSRTTPGSKARYKPGVAGLYKDLGVDCVPVATNAGVHWPAHGLIRRPGVIVFEYLQPIPAGLPRATFMQTLEHRIETACQALIAEGV